MTFPASAVFLLLFFERRCAEQRVRMESEVQPTRAVWAVRGPTPRGQLLELTFAVKQSGLTELHDTLMRVSTPSSPEYGNHLTNEQVNALTAPAPEAIEVVNNFLRSYGVEPRSATPNSDFVVAIVPVEIAEIMLSAEYKELEHISGAVVSRSPMGYSLPAHVAMVVDFVAPTIRVPGVRRSLKSDGHDREGAEVLGFNSPKNLRKLYSVGDVEGKAPTNRMAVTAFLEQGYTTDSLHKFWRMFCRNITCGKDDPKLVGDAVGGRPGTESMLDIETITGVAGNVEAELWGFSGRSPDNKENEPYLKWLIQMSNSSDKEIPKIFSTSYGEDEGSWSYSAAQRLNVEFQKAGVRGISLLYASGDEGANCKEGKYFPEGPGSSPYVTAVGGTAPWHDWPSPGGETAIGLSSGGFSNYWPMPDYQKEAVAAYLEQPGLPPRSLGYNTSGRAYPDISAQATDFFVIAGIPMPGVSGTSCASPTAAGIFALLNDARLQQGKPALGFLNPLIYSAKAGFFDVTTGASRGCDFSPGWPATVGWDAVTGMGTPNYAKLAAAIAELPAKLAAETAIVV